jgi:hypothetical protein
LKGINLPHDPPEPCPNSPLTPLADSPPSSPPQSSDSSSSNSHFIFVKIPNCPKNVAYVKQDSSSKPPMLHCGNIMLEIMHDFKDCCMGYFKTKDITADKQVYKILASFCNTHIKDWVSTNHACLVTKTFPEFMKEFYAAYLNED